MNKGFDYLKAKLDECEYDLSQIQEEHEKLRLLLEEEQAKELTPEPRVGDIVEYINKNDNTVRRLVIGTGYSNCSLNAINELGVYTAEGEALKRCYCDGTYKLIGNVFDIKEV